MNDDNSSIEFSQNLPFYIEEAENEPVVAAKAPESNAADEAVTPPKQDESEAVASQEPKEAVETGESENESENAPTSQALHDAYLRGRNEAIAEAAATDNSVSLQAVNRTPGVTDPATPPSDPFLAKLFRHRPSVWD